MLARSILGRRGRPSGSTSHPASAGGPPGRRLLRWDEVIYRDELERLRDDGLMVVHTLTRSKLPGWTGYVRRVDAEMLDEVGPSPAELPHAYACGPTEASSERPSSLLVVPTSLVKISTTDGPQLVLGRESSGGKRGWQTEGLEQLRIHERHDLLDQVTTQGKHADAVARECAGLLVPHVRRERRLGIC